MNFISGTAGSSVTYSPARRRAKRQLGLTLVELLVALTISSVIAIAAVSALIVSRQGLTTVDAASQLRDNGRFAVDLIQRLGVQAGYQDLIYSTVPRPANAVGVSANPDPSVFGVNNAKPSPTDPYNTSTVRTAGVGYGSDILILRY
jgi:type IV pilus assembly protein PilW